MKIRIGYAFIAVLIAMSSLGISVAAAHDHGESKWDKNDHDHATGLVREVRQGTRRFRDVTKATDAGYGVFLGCISGPQEGAMGIHFVNAALVGDGVVDARQPEALIYEARNGRLRLVGVEFVIIAEVWDANNDAPPALLGQSFHFSESPNRFGLPAFYSLHVWAWRNNPHGMFVNWNPKVSCEEFTTVAE